MNTKNPDTASEKVCVVDSCDRVTGSASRSEMRSSGLLHRVTYLMVFNRAGELLVQQRTRIKDWYPGRLDLAAGGVVQYGETYAQSAARELQEELGIEADLSPQFKLYFEDRNAQPVTRSWGTAFTCVSEGPFRLQEAEVAAAEFMSVEKALGLAPTRITPDTLHVLLAYLL